MSKRRTLGYETNVTPGSTPSTISIRRTRMKKGGNGNLTNYQRKLICEFYLRTGGIMSQKDLAQWTKHEFGLNKTPAQSTISGILRRQHEYINMSVQELGIKKRRVVQHPHLDEALANWVIQCAHRGIAVQGDMTKEKGKYFAQLLQIPEEEQPEFSNGWLHSFQVRHNFSFRKFHNYVHSRESSKFLRWTTLDAMAEVVQKYELRDIFCIHETGILYQRAPDDKDSQVEKFDKEDTQDCPNHSILPCTDPDKSTYPKTDSCLDSDKSNCPNSDKSNHPESNILTCPKSEKSTCPTSTNSHNRPHPNSNATHKRIVIALACNANGTERLQPLFISHHSQPKCFRTKSAEEHAFQYFSNPRAHMTPIIFSRWIERLDSVMSSQRRRILLFLHPSSSHVVAHLDFTNITVFFLPCVVKHSQVVQHPLLSGNILATFKKRWRMQHLAHACQRKNLGIKQLYKTNVLNAIQWAIASWYHLTSSEIADAWRLSGIIRSENADLLCYKEKERLLEAEMNVYVSALELDLQNVLNDFLEDEKYMEYPIHEEAFDTVVPYVNVSDDELEEESIKDEGLRVSTHSLPEVVIQQSYFAPPSDNIVEIPLRESPEFVYGDLGSHQAMHAFQVQMQQYQMQELNNNALLQSLHPPSPAANVESDVRHLV